MHNPPLLRSIALAALIFGCFGCAKGDLIQPGTRAPDRTLQDQTGAPRSLASFKGRPLVVFFYPRDGTPGCTREACAFRDAWDRYERAGIQVVGVSTDDVASHRSFAQEHQLPFPLLSDTEGDLSRAFGVRTRLGMAARVTFLLDREGIVRATFRDVDPGVHANEVIEAAHRLALSEERD